MRFSKTVFLLFLLGFYLFRVTAQIPPGYYDPAAGLSGTSLKSALHGIIDNHTSISYTQVIDALKVLEEDPANSSNVILFYKRTSQSKSTFGSGVNDWNREHLWPSSHGDFGTSIPEGTDLHHLRATDVTVNSDRGDKDFDNCQASGTQHPEATLCYYTTDAWEPPDEVKGDVARAIFYMVVRYEGDPGESDLELSDFYTSTSSGNGYLGIKQTLLQWNEDDPPDTYEIDRNNTIYQYYQYNRNPFIDHPEYATLIWGDGFAPEPLQHAQNFSGCTITLQWDDATGPVLPDGYLVRMSNTGFNDITAPTDGTPVAEDFWNKTAPFGNPSCIFGGLTPGTTYYFKIFGFTGSGANIDYKTDGSVPQTSVIAQ
ncbi:MAG: hypothetical protein Kow00127_11200 [Bacteroidales bacterium]